MNSVSWLLVGGALGAWSMYVWERFLDATRGKGRK